MWSILWARRTSDWGLGFSPKGDPPLNGSVLFFLENSFFCKKMCGCGLQFWEYGV